MRPRRVVVSGGEGFIGARVCAEVERRGDVPVVLDRSVGLDVRNAEDCQRTIEGADAVVHLAGVLGTAELFDAPEEAVDVNIKGSLNVIRACHAAGAHYVGITMPPVWESVYAVTKKAATGLASCWHRHLGLYVSHVRAFNAYGPGQKHGSGHPQKIIPTFATLAYEGRPLPVWGDGRQRVDLIHVDDVARMLVDAIDYGHDHVFDAGTGYAVTVLEVAEFVNDLAGSSAGVEHLPMRLGEHASDEVRAEGQGWDLLTWRPEFSWDRLAKSVYSYAPVAAR